MPTKTGAQLDREIAHALKKHGKKHGVFVTSQDETANTKEVWNRGYRMMQYRRQPKALRFKHRMVNDANQDLAGGWAMKTPRFTSEYTGHSQNNEILRRVAKGLKPLGIAHGIEDRSVVDRQRRQPLALRREQ